MAKILGSQKINQEMAKIAETANGYIINGHYYNKQTMVPKPLELFEAFGSSDYLQTAQNAVIRDIGAAGAANKGKEKWTFKPMIVVDNVNPRISYSFMSNVNRNGFADEMTVIKVIEREDGSVEQVGSYHTGGSLFSGNFAYSQPINILSQNSKWICVLCSIYHTTGYWHNKIILGFNKITGEIKMFEALLNDKSNAMISPLRESEIDFYYILCHVNGGTEVRRFDYSTMTATSIKVIETSGKVTGLYLDTIYEKTGTVTNFYYVSLLNTEITFKKITLDTSKEIANRVTIEDVSVVYNSEVQSIPSLNNRDLITHVFITEILGSKFLNVAIYSRQTEFNSATQNGIYTLRIMEDSSLVAQGFTKISPSSVKGLLLSRDKSMAICGTDQAALILSFDMSTSKYKLIEILDLQPFSIGLDLEDNIWLVDGNSNLHTFSPKTPTVVDIQFEKNGYSYEGKEINSSISIDSKNYQGNRIACQLELTIKGNAVFASNNSKIIIEFTDTTKAKTLPIKIQGAGNISIYPKLILN